MKSSVSEMTPMDGVSVQEMLNGDLNAMLLKLEISVSKMTSNENFCSRSTMKKIALF